jgi:predicted dehydrogenase
VLTSNSVNIGPSKLFRGIGGDELTELSPPESYRLIPQSMSAGPGRNVAQAYARLAEAIHSDKPNSPDFEHAVTRHRLIDAMERSSNEGKVIKLI